MVDNPISNWTANPQSLNISVTSYATVTEEGTVRGKTNTYADPQQSDVGIEPWRAAGLNAAQVAQLPSLLAVDARGAARPQGRGWDAGAYEVG